MYFIFIYGTLKKWFHNHDDYLSAARFLGQYQTVAAYPLVVNGARCVPCLVDRPGEGFQVSGELYEVDAALLKRLDALEAVGQPGGYRRRTIQVVPADDPTPKPLDVLAYLMDPENVKDPRTPYLQAYSREQAAKYRRKLEP